MGLFSKKMSKEEILATPLYSYLCNYFEKELKWGGSIYNYLFQSSKKGITLYASETDVRIDFCRINENGKFIKESTDYIDYKKEGFEKFKNSIDLNNLLIKYIEENCPNVKREYYFFDYNFTIKMTDEIKKLNYEAISQLVINSLSEDGDYIKAIKSGNRYIHYGFGKEGFTVDIIDADARQIVYEDIQMYESFKCFDLESEQDIANLIEVLKVKIPEKVPAVEINEFNEDHISFRENTSYFTKKELFEEDREEVLKAMNLIRDTQGAKSIIADILAKLAKDGECYKYLANNDPEHKVVIFRIANDSYLYNYHDDRNYTTYLPGHPKFCPQPSGKVDYETLNVTQLPDYLYVYGLTELITEAISNNCPYLSYKYVEYHSSLDNIIKDENGQMIAIVEPYQEDTSAKHVVFQVRISNPKLATSSWS